MDGPLLNLYPRMADGLVRQCAWCRRVADQRGEFRLRAAELIESASHGCCEACLTRLLGGGAAIATVAA